MTDALRCVFDRLVDFIWPRNCPLTECGRPSDRPHRHICSTCFAALPVLEAGGVCSVCGMPIPAETHSEFVCEECLHTKPAYERARAALRYAGDVPTLVQDFKYRRALHLTDDFVDLLEAAARTHFDAAAIDVVMPVPLHPHRRRERGYNQSSLLASALAARLNRRQDASSLIRVRDTDHQARITGEERRRNLHAAFAVPRPEYIRGRTILVVDDVMTTGSTLDACAHVLKKAGAHHVWGLALARAIRGEAR